ncbi:MAG: glycosyltransferase family 4 protein [Burkholderiaceae bacterium]
MTGLWLAAVLAAILCVLGLRFALARGFPNWLDLPNDRSLHVRPVPRIGGLAVLGATIATLIVGAVVGAYPAPTLPTAVLWIATLVLALASALDDRRGLPVLPRLLAHACAAAALVVALAFDPATALPVLASPAPWVAIALVLAIVWFTNLYNFMDGADGLAGTMTVIGFAGYAWMAPGDDPIAWLAAAIAGAAAGFLRWNWAPARVFLGDAGSIPAGFLAAGIGLLGAARGYWSLWAPVGLFLPFVSDASVTLLTRAIRGRRIWQAHREHAYQRLILQGRPVPWVAAGYATLSLIATVTVATSAYQTEFVSNVCWAVIIVLQGGVLVLAARGADQPSATRP